MSKKRFTAGLESLLSSPDDAALQGHVMLSAESTNAKSSNTTSETISPEAGKKAQGKRFTDDLQAFLMEAFEESFERQMQQLPAEAEIKKRSSKPMEGLDALIRSTVEPKVQFDQHATRRLTLQFDERKLEKLKAIARMEKTLLRDIIDGIVEEYIARWEKQKQP
ncbi:MAG: hypothetical protein SFV55_01170 [Haliscomenobacter sp.]|uniref:hypothetical protein n=1 Tax=Haliscomenobacter sp. TaxID=2717303 RepID=UPI0029A39E16|nr:hypothetical protein [Haliscomenobacter sp.]MDX2066999.1 hypothetical protein [Haliscomenobacter sp.]